MLDPCLPFPDSVEGIFPTQKVYQGIEGFPCWRGYNDSFENVDKGDNNNIDW